jgi:hypothetical protein
MGWKQIQNTTDIEHLMKSFGYFHDSCLKELHMWSEHFVDDDLSMSVSSGLDHRVRILFQRQGSNPSAIELMFEQVTQMHILPSPENHDSIIYNVSFIFKDDLFYWANDSSWRPEDKAENQVSWLSSKEVKWRDGSDWMGDELRYTGGTSQKQ